MTLAKCPMHGTIKYITVAAPPCADLLEIAMVQTSYNLKDTHTRHATKTRVHAKFVFCVCLRVLSLKFSIIVSRHFNVINRTL